MKSDLIHYLQGQRYSTTTTPVSSQTAKISSRDVSTQQNADEESMTTMVTEVVTMVTEVDSSEEMKQNKASKDL